VKKSKDTHDAYGKVIDSMQTNYNKRLQSQDDLIKMLAVSNINVTNKLLNHVTSTSKAKSASGDNMKTLKLLNKEQTQ
ncbi:2515_t:CDS:2, partial [Dentiscutata heterogama]